MSSSPPEVALRAATPGDAEAVAELVRALEGEHGRPLTGPGQVRIWWERVALDRDSWLSEEGGRLLAAAWLERSGDVPEAVVTVHPRATGRGLGSTLLSLAEARAAGDGTERLQALAFASDLAGRSLLESRGFREVRRYYGMEIDLAAPPPPAEWPDGLRVESFRREDARVFFDVFREAFADEWGHRELPFEEWVRLRVDSPDADHSLWFLARAGDEVVAVARCEGDRGDLGWIGALGVRRAWRRRGVGLALLRHAIGEFHRRGKGRVGLGVDAENPTGATRLYERAGMRVTIEEILFEKDLT